MTQQTFLVEIGTEELPPKALRSLAESLPLILRLNWITLICLTVR